MEKDMLCSLAGFAGIKQDRRRRRHLKRMPHAPCRIPFCFGKKIYFRIAFSEILV